MTVLLQKRNEEKDNGKKEVRNANGVSENEGKIKKLHELFMNQVVT